MRNTYQELGAMDALRARLYDDLMLFGCAVWPDDCAPPARLAAATPPGVSTSSRTPARATPSPLPRPARPRGGPSRNVPAKNARPAHGGKKMAAKKTARKFGHAQAGQGAGAENQARVSGRGGRA